MVPKRTASRVNRVADRLDLDHPDDRALLRVAVETAIAEGLEAAEIVLLIDELERRTGRPLHPYRFDDTHHASSNRN
ncbi:MAG: hypothetical protein ACM33T_09985 [Solirubrobacterales bacterium]